MFDLIIRNAQLHQADQTDIAIKDGIITKIAPKIAGTAEQEIDAAGNLTLPAFINGQLHACKSYWRRLLKTLPAEVQNLPRFEAASKVKELYTAENVFERVDEAMQLAVSNGTCAIRLFGDVDDASGTRAIEGLLAIKQKYSPFMTVQVVAFPQDGFAHPKTAGLMHDAMKMGADIVGGIPWIESNDQGHIDRCFELAREFDADLHFVCDDGLDWRLQSLEKVAATTIKTGWHGRVSATQCAALASYKSKFAWPIIWDVKEAGMTIFSNSHVSLIATDFDESRFPWPRGITRIPDLLKAEVPVACAQDDIDNWFYPFGRNDMLEVASFMAHNGRFAWHGDVDQVLPMVTSVPAKALGIKDYGLSVGSSADIVVINAADWHSAVQFQPAKRFVILKGQLAAESQRSTSIYL